MSAHSLDNGVGRPTRFRVVPERSAVLVKARSNVGPITFGTSELSGDIRFEAYDGSLAGIHGASAHLDIQVSSMASGNALYDAEMHRRIDGRRYPTITVELASCAQVADSNRFLLGGKLVLHDIVQAITGSVSVAFPDSNTLVIEGEHELDIRDFRIELPSTLLLKIYPEVAVEMHLEASIEP